MIIYFYLLVFFALFYLHLEQFNLQTNQLKHTKAETVQPIDVVNCLIGAINNKWDENSIGNVVPVISVPFGATHISIDNTGTLDGWWYQRDSRQFKGIRFTNQPSPWIGDHAFFNIQIGGARSFGGLEFKPNELSLITDNDAMVEVTVTDHGAILKFKNTHTLVFKYLSNIQINGRCLNATAQEITVFHKKKFKRYVTICFVDSNPLLTYDIAKFSSTQDFTVTVGLSYISHDQSNIVSKKLKKFGYNTIKDLSRNIWNKQLRRVPYNQSFDKVTFYSNVYRSLLFPKILSERNVRNEIVHGSPYDRYQYTYKGHIVTGNGFWDTYISVYTFLQKYYPDIYKIILNGWVNAIKEDKNNMLPQWASPGRVASMVGSMGEVVICKGILNGVIDDVDTAYKYLIQSATNTSVYNGRAHLKEYIDLGYVPAEYSDSVALSLNYMYTDSVVSKCALELGDFDLATELKHRSEGFTSIFDYNTKFFRPKNRQGKFLSNFNQYEWMGAYTEGGPFQYRFYAPHDIDGLLLLYGGNKRLCDEIESITQTPNAVSNGYKIHEMTEMQALNFGQYAHNNQPSHHILHVMKRVCPERAVPYINYVLDKFYTKDGYVGDEDNGEMSTWYLLTLNDDFEL